MQAAQVVPLKIEPNKDLVAMLECLLARARSGEMSGFGYAALYSDASFSTGWDIRGRERDRLCTSVGVLHHRIIAQIASEG